MPRCALLVVAWDGGDADVRSHLVAGGCHGRPGSDRAGRGGDSTTSIDAVARMWECFSEQPKP